jgi:hypothetical protein
MEVSGRSRPRRRPARCCPRPGTASERSRSSAAPRGGLNPGALSRSLDILAGYWTRSNTLPGADDRTPLLAVSRTGATTSDVIVLSPDDLLTAWEAPQ